VNAIYLPIDARSHNVRRELWPEARPVWPLRAVWLEPSRVRCYGAVAPELAQTLGVSRADGKVPLFLHQQAPSSHRRLDRAFGSEAVGDVLVTPTSSYRSVLCAGGASEVVGLKLSIGATIGKRRRALKESQIARATLMSALLDTISVSDRSTMGLDWFAEPAGVVDIESKHGWLLRKQPTSMAVNDERWLCPAFSLLSSHEGKTPLVVDMIGRSGLSPETFLVERVLLPYINVLAYLLFEQGIQIEGHSQNVLFEIDAAGELTGKVVLRDLSDATVSLGMRIAKRKVLPDLSAIMPKDAPLRLVSNACDFQHNIGRPRLLRASDTVERYGLSGMVWPFNQSLSRFFASYDKRKVEVSYLMLWQQAAVAYLNLRPAVRREPLGLATDEALALFLSTTDWASLGAREACELPPGAECVLTDGPRRGKKGPLYQRIETSWGDLFLERGRPGFFRAAF